jgi:hypothetical protein
VAWLRNCNKIARHGLRFVCRCKFNECPENSRREQDSEGSPNDKSSRVANRGDKPNGGDEQERRR